MRILIFLVFFVGCSKVYTNKIDEQHYLCGDGVEAGKEYIKISDESHIVTFPEKVKKTTKGCIERPKTGDVLVTNADRFNCFCRSWKWQSYQSFEGVITKSMGSR